MLISVLIAAYKAGPYIAQALASVRSQTHGDWELIVVEDGSSDQTESLVSSFAAGGPNRVVFQRHEGNKGVAETRNTLMSLARGDAIAFLDADDLWAPEHLANAAEALGRGADFVVADVRAFNLATGETLHHYGIGSLLSVDPVGALFEKSHIVTSSAVTIRREFAERAGRFLSDLKVGEDRDFWIRCAKAGARFAATPRTCHYAKHPNSTMARTLLVAEQEVLFYEKYSTEPMIPGWKRRRLLAHSLANLGRLLRSTDRATALRHLRRAWKLNPLNLKTTAQLCYTLIHR